MRSWGVEQKHREFTEIYAAAKDDCLRIVLVSVGDRQLAEDLVAEAFTRAWIVLAEGARSPGAARMGGADRARARGRRLRRGARQGGLTAHLRQPFGHPGGRRGQEGYRAPEVPGVPAGRGNTTTKTPASTGSAG
jgi:hypothetical protein